MFVPLMTTLAFSPDVTTDLRLDHLRALEAESIHIFREVVADGETGRLVAPQEPAALAAAIDDLLADPARLAAWGAAGRARVERLFAWPVVAAHVREVYARALAKPSA